MTLQRRHNELYGVSSHRRDHCLLHCWFRRGSKKTSKLHVTGLCGGNSPVTGDFSAQRASNAENVFIWWSHHGITWVSLNCNRTKRKQTATCAFHDISTHIYTSHQAPTPPPLSIHIYTYRQKSQFTNFIGWPSFHKSRIVPSYVSIDYKCRELSILAISGPHVELTSVQVISCSVTKVSQSPWDDSKSLVFISVYIAQQKQPQIILFIYVLTIWSLWMHLVVV